VSAIFELVAVFTGPPVSRVTSDQFAIFQGGPSPFLAVSAFSASTTYTLPLPTSPSAADAYRIEQDIAQYLNDNANQTVLTCIHCNICIRCFPNCEFGPRYSSLDDSPIPQCSNRTGSALWNCICANQQEALNQIYSQHQYAYCNLTNLTVLVNSTFSGLCNYLPTVETPSIMPSFPTSSTTTNAMLAPSCMSRNK